MSKSILRMQTKLQVAVFFGGCSPEYRISLVSAAAVLEDLDTNRYTPVMIGISQDGQWFYYTGPVEKIKQDAWHNRGDCQPTILQPGTQRLLVFSTNFRQLQKTIFLDIAFPILHGKNGEDGTLQGLLRLSNIPVAGCDVLSAALCMDKMRAHQLVNAAGIAVSPAIVLEKNEAWEDQVARIAQLNLPFFVKPVRAGSSYGITKIYHIGQLETAITLARQYDEQVMIEEAIDGFEVGCAVLGYETLQVGEVDEIALAGDFFDFTEKYTLQTTVIHVPARISVQTAAEVKKLAQEVYHILGCGGFARIDFFLTTTGEILFHEVNTIPGFTAHSRFPRMMQASGLSFPDLLTTILEETYSA